MIVTNDDETAALCRMIRVHGSDKRYHHEMLGLNSRLDAIQAAILRLKLPLLNDYTAARRKIAARYEELLSDVQGIVTPPVREGHVFHQYTIRVLNGRRDELHEKLKNLSLIHI